MATKTITTIETIKLEGRTVGKILQDESGFFYRPGTAGGLHNPKKDGDHFPSVKAVMASLNDTEPYVGMPMPQATIAPKITTKAPKRVLEAKPQVLEPKPPATTSKVRYKLVETLGEVGTHYWLFAGYERTEGFKWESSGVGMFPSVEAVDKFLELNGIFLSFPVEKADIRSGHYSPNKGVIPHDDSHGQQRLL